LHFLAVIYVLFNPIAYFLLTSAEMKKGSYLRESLARRPHA
jgi:hypothetical protein